MTREELLEAIGRVDDDLIQEAEDCRLPARRPGLPHWRPLAGGLAACLVLTVEGKWDRRLLKSLAFFVWT